MGFMVREQDQWQRDQVKELINQKWNDLGEEDIKEMVQWMRKDSMRGGYIPADWTGPKSPDQYIKMVSDPIGYDYSQ